MAFPMMGPPATPHVPQGTSKNAESMSQTKLNAAGSSTQARAPPHRLPPLHTVLAATFAALVGDKLLESDRFIDGKSIY
jgi:hypothetical protein